MCVVAGWRGRASPFLMPDYMPASNALCPTSFHTLCVHHLLLRACHFTSMATVHCCVSVCALPRVQQLHYTHPYRALVARLQLQTWVAASSPAS